MPSFSFSAAITQDFQLLTKHITPAYYRILFKRFKTHDMETTNTFNGVNNATGPKTPEKDKKGNTEVEQNDNVNTSGDSQVQQGEEIVNEEEQNDIVNGQGGDAAEEFINSAANYSTSEANDSPLNNENGYNSKSTPAPQGRMK